MKNEKYRLNSTIEKKNDVCKGYAESNGISQIPHNDGTINKPTKTCTFIITVCFFLHSL